MEGKFTIILQANSSGILKDLILPEWNFPGLLIQVILPG